jgi:U2-associated protein SR140
VPRKLARLHLVSDILHNSSSTIHHAWKYRLAFESRLPRVFIHLNTIYRSFPGRMQAENFRVLVTDVTNAWENWLVFTPSNLESMQRLLVDGQSGMKEAKPVETEDQEGEDRENGSKPSGFRAVGSGAFVPVVKSDDVDGQPINAPLDVDVDGVPMPSDTVDVDGEPMPSDTVDVDGEPIGEDVDGVPIVDVDGAPMMHMDGDAAETDEVGGVPLASAKEDDMFA